MTRTGGEEPAMTAATRALTREQLEEWGVPFETAAEGGPNPLGLAVELRREQVETLRWLSVHHLVFRAPDDGQPWGVTYRQGLTESQEGYDPWQQAATVTATLMERYEKTVTAWRPEGSSAPETPEARAIADAEQVEAAASVLERRYPHARPDILDRVLVELHSIARAWRRMAGENGRG